jgi:hypothetical protein
MPGIRIKLAPGEDASRCLGPFPPLFPYWWNCPHSGRTLAHIAAQALAATRQPRHHRPNRYAEDARRLVVAEILRPDQQQHRPLIVRQFGEAPRQQHRLRYSVLHGRTLPSRRSYIIVFDDRTGQTSDNVWQVIGMHKMNYVSDSDFFLLSTSRTLLHKYCKAEL